MAGQSDSQGERIRTGHQSDYRRCRRTVGRLDLFVVRTLRRRDLRQYHNVGRGSGCPALDRGCGLPQARRKVIRPEKVNAGLKAAFVFSLPSLPLHADKLNGFKRRILTPSEPVFIDSHPFIITPPLLVPAPVRLSVFAVPSTPFGLSVSSWHSFLSPTLCPITRFYVRMTLFGCAQPVMV